MRSAIEAADIVIFTLGLTEVWEHRDSGTVYPTAPGTIADPEEPSSFAFRNLRAAEIKADFLALRDLVRGLNPNVRFLLTVSPVPLTATASGQHVLPATTYSKSVLRTVCGELVEDFEDIDYFPSYEIVTSPANPRKPFEANLRSVSMREAVSYTHLRAHETPEHLVCRLLLEK